jgi:hypothetical protein
MLGSLNFYKCGIMLYVRCAAYTYGYHLIIWQRGRCRSQYCGASLAVPVPQAVCPVGTALVRMQ